jgi:bifunctional UDP-N-acetylglucosamine pyrophosphorylase/glucosamine-1-phosphate N-acetyltransferase
MSGLPALWTELPGRLASGWDPERPWELLGDAFDEALAALPSGRIESAIGPDVHLAGDRIVIERGVRLDPGAVIEGPAFLGAGSRVRPGAYLRGGVWLAPGALVGANTELKRAILLAGARAPHLAYVGDSVLGRDVNLGAGTILSNFRHDGEEISIPHDGRRLATGRRKLGALLGDGVRTGCNCVLHPGCIVGAGTCLYPGVHLRTGVYPGGRIIKLRQQIEVVEAT